LRHGEKVLKMQWTNALKIAIAEKNEIKIQKALETLPQFDSLEKMQEAAYMMKEAHDFLTNGKKELAKNLLNLKKQKEFLSSHSSTKSSFDQHH